MKAHTRIIRALHRQGLSCREIGRRVGICATSVWKRLARRGVRRRKNVLERYDEKTKAHAAQLYRNGLGLAFVARFLRLKNKNAAARVLRSVGVAIRGQA